MSNQSNAYDFLAKFLIIGDSGVGKTCFMLRFCEYCFHHSHPPTIGIDFKMKTIEVDGKKIKVQIWDTAGQGRFKTITQTYYKGAMGIILTYSLNDRDSFENIENWVNQIKEYANEDVCKILIGNKCDMADRVVSYEEGKRLADSLGVQFFEASVKENLNIKEAVWCLAKEVKDKLEKKGGASPGGMENGAIDNEGQKLAVCSKVEKESWCSC